MSDQIQTAPEAEVVKRPPGRPPKELPRSELEFIAENISAVHSYYRALATPGHEMGINVTAELIFQLLHDAFSLGLQRKLWSAPK